ncbi:MAG: sulfite exporter TauE/SafE family protein [Calothrix sp. SM1_5_4]|nr:sulfite exporter TauE/SafE family protein [Calothrix sp. SM1_5_4]
MNIQDSLLLTWGPAFLPLAALIYSFLNSWHCSVMCGPLTVSSARKDQHTLLLFRLISYTCMGGVAGYAGRLLHSSLEYEVLRVIAFGAFAAITVFLVLPQLIPSLPKFPLNRFLKPLRRTTAPPIVRGLLIAAVPCHLLGFYYGVAALTASPWLGAGLLFGHAVMTTPGLAYAWRVKELIAGAPALARTLLRLALIVLVAINLVYLGARILGSGSEGGAAPFGICI